MRYHRTYSQFDLWREPLRLRRLVDPSTLIAARLEPVGYSLGGAAALDLTFARDGEIVVVPLIIIETAMLAEPECSAFLWPASCLGALEPSTSDAIEARILPWILSVSMGRLLTHETVRVFADGNRAVDFAQATEYGFLGAAPYERVAIAMAPYALALRSASGRRCRIIDKPSGASGVALLARNALQVSADLGSAPIGAFAARWFGIDAFSQCSLDGDFDLEIARSSVAASRAPRRFVIGGNERDGTVVPICEPIPLDLMIAFETDDSPACDAVAVTVPEPPLRQPYGGAAPLAIGGSSGRVLFVLRDDFSRIDDSDSDEAMALARALRVEGFGVDVVSASAEIDPDEYDLVHLFSLTSVAQLERLASAANSAGVTVIATANLPDVTVQGTWGTGIAMVVEKMSLDGGLMDERLGLLAARKLNSNGAGLGLEPHAGYHAALSRILGYCDGIIARTTAESYLIRDRYGFVGEIAELPPFLSTDAPTEEVAALVGDGDFILAHTPLAARSNLLALARAATGAGLPLVVAGPVTDVETLTALRRWSDDRTVILTSASSDQIASLYRRARVFADVAWISGGLARPLRALLSGCRVVLAADSYGVDLWGDAVVTADAASAPSIAAGLATAWAAAGIPEATARQVASIAAASGPAGTLSATVNLYAQAAARRARP
jgi:hypothetical protein